jgi:hypothetical protein
VLSDITTNYKGTGGQQLKPHLTLSKSGHTITTLVQTNTSLDVCGSVHHSKIHTEKSNKMQQCIKFTIPYLHEAQHVSGDTPPIISTLKLHRQPLVLHTWKVVGCVVAGCCQAEPDSVQQPSTYAKPEAASAVLGS